MAFSLLTVACGKHEQDVLTLLHSHVWCVNTSMSVTDYKHTFRHTHRLHLLNGANVLNKLTQTHARRFSILRSSHSAVGVNKVYSFLIQRTPLLSANHFIIARLPSHLLTVSFPKPLSSALLYVDFIHSQTSPLFLIATPTLSLPLSQTLEVTWALFFRFKKIPLYDTVSFLLCNNKTHLFVKTLILKASWIPSFRSKSYDPQLAYDQKLYVISCKFLFKRRVTLSEERRSNEEKTLYNNCVNKLKENKTWTCMWMYKLWWTFLHFLWCTRQSFAAN